MVNITPLYSPTSQKHIYHIGNIVKNNIFHNNIN